MFAASSSDDLWPETGIDPVKVALPAPPERQRDDGIVGYTLRAYRPVSEVTPTEAAAEDDDLFNAPEHTQPTGSGAGLADPGAEEEELLDPDESADEEVPLFLSHRGRLLLFGTPRSLVDFVHSDAPHDLRQLESWDTVVKRIRVDDIAPAADDTYELDLVVENLRGGPDAWELPLLIAAGEFARDIGYALRLEPVINTMAAGSPLDDLDESLRAAAAGGIGGVFARRRLRRFGVQQVSLGWRSIIGKISGAVDWRD